MGRQTPRGGFSFFAHVEWGVEEPNAPDTWAALEVAATLGQPVPNLMRCIAWLRAQQDEFGGYSSLVIGNAVLQALRRVNAKPERDPRPFLMETSERLRLAVTSNESGEGWLWGALRCVELRIMYEIPVTGEVQQSVTNALESLRGSAGGYGRPGANLPETALALALTTAAGLPAPAGCLSYARQCEAIPHGFNVAPHASSTSLETQLAGLQILGYFGETPRHPQRIHDYLVACQSAVGGFGRVPEAIPRLDDTLRAIKIAKMLEANLANPDLE